MTLYRTADILAAKDLGASGTEVIDIKEVDLISRLTLQWIVTKSKNAMDSYAHKDITKIELVDGSDVLFSLDGGQCQALNIYDRKVGTMNHGQAYSGNSQRSVYGLDFGRFLNDPEFALDPKRYKAPQLRVTYNEAVSDTGVTANSLEVWADVMEDARQMPSGFLSAREHINYTPGSSGSYENVELPTDEVIRRMLIQGYYAGYEPWYQLSEARLGIDNDKRVLFDVDLEKYHQLRKGIDLCVEETLQGAADGSGVASYCTPTDYYGLINITNVGGSDVAYYVNSWQRGGVFTVVSASSMPFMANVKGWCPNHCFNFPFGLEDTPESWLNPTGMGSLRLRLKAYTGGSSGSAAVVLQTIRRN